MTTGSSMSDNTEALLPNHWLRAELLAVPVQHREDAKRYAEAFAREALAQQAATPTEPDEMAAAEQAHMDVCDALADALDVKTWLPHEGEWDDAPRGNVLAILEAAGLYDPESGKIRQAATPAPVAKVVSIVSGRRESYLAIEPLTEPPVAIGTLLYATPPATPAAQPDDPLDMPLPCAIDLGGMSFGKGVRLRSLVDAARRWREDAYGPKPSPEEAAHNLAVLQGTATPAQPVEEVVQRLIKQAHVFAASCAVSGDKPAYGWPSLAVKEGEKLESALRAALSQAAPPAAQAGDEREAWINVELELPPRHKNVWCFNRDGRQFEGRICAGTHKPFFTYPRGDGSASNTAPSWIDVTHWMPLPDHPTAIKEPK